MLKIVSRRSQQKGISYTHMLKQALNHGLIMRKVTDLLNTIKSFC